MKTLLFLVVVLVLILFWVRSGVERSPLEQQFLSGKADVFPDGFWSGSSPSIPTGSWLGKEFDATTKTGFNVFNRAAATSSAEVRSLEYPFTMYVTKGARDRNLDVIKIDYNRPENPWYLRNFAYDEIVRLDDGRYLGKIEIEIVRGVPFTVGWFWQTKPTS